MGDSVPYTIDEKRVDTLLEACDAMDDLLVDKVPRLLGQCVSIIRVLKKALAFRDKHIEELYGKASALVKQIEMSTWIEQDTGVGHNAQNLKAFLELKEIIPLSIMEAKKSD